MCRVKDGKAKEEFMKERKIRESNKSPHYIMFITIIYVNYNVWLISRMKNHAAYLELHISSRGSDYLSA